MIAPGRPSAAAARWARSSAPSTGPPRRSARPPPGRGAFAPPWPCCSSTRHPMFIWWGPELIQFYNDAYGRSLGPDRHPSALGQRGRECWAEIWPVIGPEVSPSWPVARPPGRGPPGADHPRRPVSRTSTWSYSYSPILHDEGGVGGVLVTVQETTKRVVAERRGRLLQGLAARQLQAESEAEVLEAAAVVLASHPEDIPFALLYLSECLGEQTAAGAGRGSRGRRPRGPAYPRSHRGLRLAGERGVAGPGARDSGKPAGQVRSAVGPAANRCARRSWSRSSQDFRGTDATGLLVAGVNPRLAADEETRAFLDQVGREITHALDRARSQEQVRRAWRAAEQAAAERDVERQQLARIFELSPPSWRCCAVPTTSSSSPIPPSSS